MNQGNQIGCLLNTLAFVIGVPLLLLGVRVAANAGEAAARAEGKARLVTARREAAAARAEALRPLQAKLSVAQREREAAARGLNALRRQVVNHERQLAIYASRFLKVREAQGLTLAVVRRSKSLDEAIARTISQALSDRDRTEPRAGAAVSPYPRGTPASEKILELFREYRLSPPEERGRVSDELRGMREKRVDGVRAECQALPSGGRRVTLTLSDQLSPRAREILLERFKKLQLRSSSWIQTWAIRKVSYPDLMEDEDISPEQLTALLASEFSEPEAFLSEEERAKLYAEAFSYELENESPQTIEVEVAGQVVRIDPYLWKTVFLAPGQHRGVARSLKDERVRELSFELEGQAGMCQSTRLEIMYPDPKGRR